MVIRGAGGRLAGILSERDIVRAVAEHGAAALALPVGQVMTRKVMTCSEDDNDRQHHGADDGGKIPPYAGGEQGKLVGLISIGDVVKQRVEEIEHEAEAMRDYIRTRLKASDDQILSAGVHSCRRVVAATARRPLR